MQVHVGAATVACLYLQLLLLVICELTVYSAPSQNIDVHDFLWFATPPFLVLQLFTRLGPKE